MMTKQVSNKKDFSIFRSNHQDDCCAGSLMMTGYGDSDADLADTKSALSETYDDQVDDNSSTSAVKARVEMNEHQCHLDNPRDITLCGAINHSFGQDIVALNLEDEEVTRVSLAGNNGDEESFKIVIPSRALTNPTPFA